MRDVPCLRGRSQALLTCRISWEHAQGGARVWVPSAGRGRVQPGPGVTPQGLGFRTTSHGKPTCPAVQRTPRAQAAPPLYGSASPQECQALFFGLPRSSEASWPRPCAILRRIFLPLVREFPRGLCGFILRFPSPEKTWR